MSPTLNIWEFFFLLILIDRYCCFDLNLPLSVSFDLTESVHPHLPPAVCAEETASVTLQEIKTYFSKHLGGVFIHIISEEIG